MIYKMTITPETRLKMRLAKLGKKRPDISRTLTGRKLSEEHKDNIKKNNSKYWFGKKRSEEDVEKFRVSHLGQVPWNKGLKLPQFGGENASSWKGDDVGYGALHEWVVKEKGQPIVCEDCRRRFTNTYKIHWANISGEYRRDLKDWKRLCVSCHLKFDKERRHVAFLRNKGLKKQI